MYFYLWDQMSQVSDTELETIKNFAFSEIQKEAHLVHIALSCQFYIIPHFRVTIYR